MNASQMLRLAASLALCGLLMPATAGAASDPVLGRDGTILRLESGLYGELLPEGLEAAAESPVLVLERLRPDGSSERHLVPGTESRDSEGSYTLLFEDRSQTAYVLWESFFNDIHPVLYLTSFGDEGWSEVIEIVSGSFTRKGSPQLAVTRELEGDGDERTIVHLSWWEDGLDGSRKLYTPILIMGGEYQGRSAVFDLGEFSSATEENPGLPVSAGIENALTLSPGTDRRSLIAGFFNPLSGHLVSLRLEVLPDALSDFADKARAEFIVLGNKVDTYGELADLVRVSLVDLSDEIHIAVRVFLAEQAAAMAAATEGEVTPEGVLALADKARAEFIVLGFKLRANGLARESEGRVVDIGPADRGEPLRHLAGITVVGVHPAPEVGGVASLYLSESGQHALVAWDEDTDFVVYRETTEEGWSEAATIELGKGIDRATVHRMLADRVRDR